jgi:tetratricopeptide (TPR) repeat protein
LRDPFFFPLLFILLILSKIGFETELGTLTRCTIAGSLPAVRIAAAAALLLLAGCSTPYPRARAFFPSATINNQSARLALDTGAAMTSLFDTGADRLDVPTAFTPPDFHVNGEDSNDAVVLSPPLDIAIGDQSFSAPLSIITFPWYQNWTLDWLGADGVIGWSQVRDNILVFDASSRTIRAVPTLPPETAGWLKYRILPTLQLRLEVPLGDGAFGHILIDTGSPEGVSLPQTAWSYWRDNHPNDRAVNRYYSMPGLKTIPTAEVWADKINIGQLTLTDVPIHPAQSIETANIPNYAGTLGLYALTRLDLVLDGHTGFAYLHPRPPPGPPYPGFPRPGDPDPENSLPADANWTVANSVRLQVDPLYFYAGYVKYHAGDFPGALDSFTAAFQLNPQNLAAREARAEVEIILTRYDDAIVDLNAVIERVPRDPGLLYHRAIARQLLGDDLGAIADYSRIINLQPYDSPNARLNRFILHRQLGQPEDDFASALIGWPDGWTKTLAKFLLGQVSEPGLLAIAAQPNPDDPDAAAQHQVMALYFAGMLHHLNNDDPAARALWQKSLALKLPSFDEYQALTRNQLTLLDPTPPK